MEVQISPTSTAPGTRPWGSEGASTSDLQIPRLALMQSMSDSVKEERAKAGDIVDNLTGEVLAKRGQKLEFIPIMTFREWWVLEKQGTESRLIARFAATPENEHLPLRDIVDGKTIERNLVLSFLVMRPKQEGLPYLIQFRKTSMKAGRKLSTAVQVNSFKGLPAASHVYALGCKEEAKDKHKYYVFTVDVVRQSSKEEVEAARQWYDKKPVREPSIQPGNDTPLLASAVIEEPEAEVIPF